MNASPPGPSPRRDPRLPGPPRGRLLDRLRAHLRAPLGRRPRGERLLAHRPRRAGPLGVGAARRPVAGAHFLRPAPGRGNLLRLRPRRVALVDHVHLGGQLDPAREPRAHLRDARRLGAVAAEGDAHVPRGHGDRHRGHVHPRRAQLRHRRHEARGRCARRAHRRLLCGLHALHQERARRGRLHRAAHGVEHDDHGGGTPAGRPPLAAAVRAAGRIGLDGARRRSRSSRRCWAGAHRVRVFAHLPFPLPQTSPSNP